MGECLKAYSQYKPSRLPWLDKVPAHWEETRAKYLFREVDERSTTGQEELLSVSHITGVTPRRQKSVTMFKAESYVGSKLCRPGDLVINTMWAWMAALGISKDTGIVSPSYHVYRPMLEMTPGFYDYLLRTQPYASEYICRSTGIRSSRLRLYPEEFLDIPILYPPVGEQSTIFSYLTIYDRAVRRILRNKSRIIDLLGEQKLVVIRKAMTGCLDPDAHLGPSEYDWLEEIPCHWKVQRLKSITNVVLGKMLKSSPSNGDYLKPYLRSANIQWLSPKLDDVSEMWFSPSEMHHLRLRAGDVLVSEGGEVGRACLWSNQLPECYRHSDNSSWRASSERTT